LEYRRSIGGEEAIRNYCQQLARAGGRLLAHAWGTEILENEEGTLGDCCFTNVRLPLNVRDVGQIIVSKGGDHDDVQTDKKIGKRVRDHMEQRLLVEHNTFFAIIFYAGAWWVRMSAQVYLEIQDFEWAAKVLRNVCDAVRKGDVIASR
jgi:hercynylcysteine S-oxide lyase